MQSALQLGLISQSESSNLAFVFPPLVLAAIFAFLTCEALGATLIGLIAFSWLSTALILYFSPPPQTSVVLGVFSLIVTLVLVLLGAVAVLGKPLLATLVAVAAVRYG